MIHETTTILIGGVASGTPNLLIRSVNWRQVSLDTIPLGWRIGTSLTMEEFSTFFFYLYAYQRFQLDSVILDEAAHRIKTYFKNEWYISSIFIYCENMLQAFCLWLKVRKCSRNARLFLCVDPQVVHLIFSWGVWTDFKWLLTCSFRYDLKTQIPHWKNFLSWSSTVVVTKLSKDALFRCSCSGSLLKNISEKCEYFCLFTTICHKCVFSSAPEEPICSCTIWNNFDIELAQHMEEYVWILNVLWPYPCDGRNTNKIGNRTFASCHLYDN